MRVSGRNPGGSRRAEENRNHRQSSNALAVESISREREK